VTEPPERLEKPYDPWLHARRRCAHNGEHEVSNGEGKDWDATLADLREQRSAARAMGGEERLAKHRADGKLDARARIDHLLDRGSFQELGTLVGGADAPADAIVIGSGRIEGRPVMVAAEDFTVKAGTISQAANAKRYRVAEIALLDRVPLVMMLDGAGYRADGRAHARTPTDLLAQGRCSGRVPLVTAVLGSSAGHGALVAPMSDFTVMSSHAAIFTAGPPVVRESLGESVTKEDLGGPSVAVASGLIHNAAADDRAALDLVRRYLGYFPSSAWSYPPDAAAGDTEARLVPEIVDLVPRNGRRTYEMRDVLEVVFDRSSCFEVQPQFGKSVVCALAHLAGHPVAVVANQPRVLAGSVDVDGAEKAAHFITVADSFHLPLVFLADNPGVMPGLASEKQGILRSGARMFAAQTLATSPKLQVTLRKAYGFGSMVMGMIPFDGQSAVFALPGATMGAMGASAMSRATGADADEAERLRRAELEASYRSASSLGFDELIDPREIRNVLVHALERALFRRQAAPEPVARVGILP
jgi:acetyl-CoA carboxylase carboxyltransferase component